ncbi:MAG: hypothetical protein HN816_11475, partial [Gammaproteobacteria bacterium]|nr:hypothetical protein [Gammaproteobacteria bacterium]
MNKVISLQEAEAYLRQRMDDQLNVHRVFQTFPGISRETWMVDGAYASGEPLNLVIRITPPNGGNCPFPLKAEYEVYKRLQDSPVPIAKVLWYDEGIEFADGRDHMVRVLVEGGTDVAGIADPGPDGDRAREHACKEHASKLGILHTLDWREYGFGDIYPAPEDPADAIRSELEQWRIYWHDNKTDAYPMITEAFYWLESLVPTENVHLCLTKGNNGLGEEIWKDDSIVAMSDWELAALAD